MFSTFLDNSNNNDNDGDDDDDKFINLKLYFFYDFVILHSDPVDSLT